MYVDRIYECRTSAGWRGEKLQVRTNNTWGAEFEQSGSRAVVLDREQIFALIEQLQEAAEQMEPKGVPAFVEHSRA
jgi:hypothetical protein